MRIHYWSPVQDADILRRQIDQVFDNLNQFSAPVDPVSTPALELWETPEALILNVQLPGIDTAALDIQATRDRVMIAGDRTPAPSNGNVLRSELSYGKFQRAIALPLPIQIDQIQATYQNGILTLTLPKAIEVRRQVVKVNVVQPATVAVDASASADSTPSTPVE